MKKNKESADKQEDYHQAYRSRVGSLSVGRAFILVFVLASVVTISLGWFLFKFLEKSSADLSQRQIQGTTDVFLGLVHGFISHYSSQVKFIAKEPAVVALMANKKFGVLKVRAAGYKSSIRYAMKVRFLKAGIDEPRKCSNDILRPAGFPLACPSSRDTSQSG